MDATSRCLVPDPAEQNDLDDPLDSGELDGYRAGIFYCIAVGVCYRAGYHCRAGSETKRLVTRNPAAVVNADCRGVGFVRYIVVNAIIRIYNWFYHCRAEIIERNVGDSHGFYF